MYLCFLTLIPLGKTTAVIKPHGPIQPNTCNQKKAFKVCRALRADGDSLQQHPEPSHAFLKAAASFDWKNNLYIQGEGLPGLSKVSCTVVNSYHPPHDASSHSLNFHLRDVQSKVCFHIQQKHYSHESHKFHLKNRSCCIKYQNRRRHIASQPRTRDKVYTKESCRLIQQTTSTHSCKHSSSTAQQGDGEKCCSKGSRSPKQSPRHRQPIQGASLRQPTRDKAEVGSRSQNTSSIPSKMPWQLIQACTPGDRQGKQWDASYSLPPNRRSSTNARRPAILPALCLGTLHSNTAYVTFWLSKSLQTMPLWKTQRLKTGEQGEKKPDWKMIPHSNLPRSPIYLCILGIWVKAISYSFKPLFFLRCVIEKEGLFTQIKLLETALEEGTRGCTHLFITLQPFPPGKN